MEDIICEIYERGNGEYRVRTEKEGNFSVYAKDELDAYTKGIAYIERKEKEMRVFYVCVTVCILFLFSTITFACEQRSGRYTANMKHCISAGKSYVSEYDGYSCRDPAAAPYAKDK